MGERAHTKGPWTAADKAAWFRGQQHPDHGKIAISAGPGGTVANVYGRENAALIAAAPDMFEALVQARDWLRGWASAETQLAIIEAALAKASPSASSGRNLADAHKNPLPGEIAP